MESNIKQILIKLSGEDPSETVYAEQTGNDSYRLLENPIFNCRINYGTVVKVREENGQLIMSSILRASSFKTRKFFLDPNSSVKDWGSEIGKSIIDNGGMWEIVMGGICFINLPRNSTFDLDDFFRQNNYYPSEIIDNSESGV